jgi:general secretion pathway protein G
VTRKGVDFGCGCLHCVYMKRSLPLAQCSVGGLQFSGPRRVGAGFTLIELMVVIGVIAILAGFVLAAMGGVNDRAARSRAKAEIAAMANALETYRSQHGSYPSNKIVTIGKTKVTTVPYATISNWYEPPTGSLQNEGTADAYLTDPYGNAYTYLFPQPVRNFATYDLFSGGRNPNETNSWIGNW